MVKNIGLPVKNPKKICKDPHCPFHGELRVRGRIFQGTAVSTKMQKTAIVKWNRLFYLQKYERYEPRTTRVAVHNPECLDIREGNTVKIMECKPISKTKKFVIIEKVK